jgi:hypothetical protein
MSVFVMGAVLALSSVVCSNADGSARVPSRSDSSQIVAGAVASSPAQPGGQAAPTTTSAARKPLSVEEKQFYRDVARASWSFLNTYYQPATGFVNATPDWANTTLWDVGAQILAYYSAKELGLITAEEYDKRTTETLNTLERVPLFQKAAFNKLYSTKEVGFGSGGRHGWSATDLGRFLLALKILSVREPKYAAQIERIARRNDFAQIVKNGYMYGQLIGSSGKPWTFQEGRIGYEQYAASGFSQWGADVGNALDVKKNSEPMAVLGVPLLADRRYQDRLLSEPFILYGIELGLTGEYAQLAANVLKAQEARFASTGKITIASEDALSVPPDYFYYYCVICSRKPFVIDLATPGKERDNPRWVSTKASFGWHALMPSDYTKKVMEYIAPAKDAQRGWASGVMESTGASTKTFDINTAAVLLEIAFYQLRGGVPLMQAAPTPTN